MTACLSVSAKPQRISRSDNVARVVVSAKTAHGGWKAPMRFLPDGKSAPVLPPMPASTMAKRVVGRLSQRMPRNQAEAAKPVKSPVTPPPKAITKSLRSKWASPIASHKRFTVARVLFSSPAGIVTTGKSLPRTWRTRSAYNGTVFESPTNKRCAGLGSRRSRMRGNSLMAFGAMSTG